MSRTPCFINWLDNCTVCPPQFTFLVEVLGMTRTTPIDYAELLLDLRSRRRQIDQAIAGIEALIELQAPIELGDPLNAGKTVALTNQSNLRAGEQRHNDTDLDPAADRGPFLGKSILSAARSVLAKHDQPMTANELSDALIKGGYPAKSKNFANTVAAVLNRCDKTGGNIIRVGKNLFTLVNQRHSLAIPDQGNSNG